MQSSACLEAELSSNFSRSDEQGLLPIGMFTLESIASSMVEQEPLNRNQRVFSGLHQFAPCIPTE
jgi:hypothetical protein